MFRYSRGLTALALALFLPLAACDDTTDTEFGSVSVLLTDAPGDEVVEAWVTITDIYLQGSAGEDDPETGRVYLLEDVEETHELLNLAETVEELVRDRQVPTGTYGQLRMVISDGCVETDDGSVYASSTSFDLCGAPTGDLQMPSFAQSGAKVLLNGLTVQGGQQIILLDFNVKDSFGRLAGASDRWVMTPVIHASEIELTAGAEVTLSAGDVTLPEGYELDQFSATLLPTSSDSSRVAFTDSDEDGIFEAAFVYVLPETGPFEVRLNAPDGLVVTTDPTSPQPLSLSSGQVGVINWVLQSAEEDAGS